ncbi:uncharacterized protein LOC122041021 isoform X2 [Zingiber officinale]|uniref:uncharacterized protein LOC122041021 isoform X2 n=1 Tax=Zingiber officinale TaxID=94328 RepID=UPI001C4C867B|nr:uncharacterized protein LOC122041021 isoform X2 [Zingiber officinale]
MAESIHSHDASSVPQQRFVITNNYGEKLVAVLHETGSKKLVILCHGFRATKDDQIVLNLSDAITSKDISVVRFDFSGNGDSEGTFEYGNYWKEVEDLHSVLLYFSEKDYETSAVVGHSKGGDVVLLYASKYADAHTVINLSGRFDLKRGIENVLGEDYLQRIKIDGFIDVMDKNGKFAFRVTEQSLMDRLNIDMHAACLSIDKKCRIFTVHGSADEIIPVEDAYEIAKLIPNHKLHIIEGADHCYTKHQEDLAKVVVNFLASVQQTKKDPRNPSHLHSIIAWFLHLQRNMNFMQYMS